MSKNKLIFVSRDFFLAKEVPFSLFQGKLNGLSLNCCAMLIKSKKKNKESRLKTARNYKTSLQFPENNYGSLCWAFANRM